MKSASISERILQSSENAIEDLYRLYRNEFLQWSRKNFQLERDDALDEFQECVIIFYKNVKEKNEVIFNEKTYLFQIAKFRILNRKKKDIPSYDIALYTNTKQFFTSIDDIEEETEDNTDALLSKMNEIGTSCKTLLELYYFVKLSTEKIAEKLGYKNADAVKSQKYKCIQKLKSLIKYYVE